MADEIRQYSFTIPAGTTQAAPARKDVSFPPREVQGLEIAIPPGPSGLMGFAIQNSGVTVIPYGSDPFIIASDAYLTWPLHGYINSGSWQILGYNTDVFDHTVYVRFLLGLVGARPGPPAVNLAALSGLTSAGGPSTADLAAIMDASG